MVRRRQIQLADAIRDIIAGQLTSGISDPRVDGVVITHVKLTQDLQIASVYYRVYRDGFDLERVEKGLSSCTPVFRRELAKQLDVRRVCELRFVFDKSIEEGSKIERLIDELKS